MSNITMKQLLEAGVQFGHQTKRWNPKMKKYIFDARNGIYIIDLQKTLQLFREACEFVKNLVAEGEAVVYIGTKKQAQDVITEEAERGGMFYVNQRWLGGTLTNFSTIHLGIVRLKKYEEIKEQGFPAMKKKEVSRIERELFKLQKYFGGVRGMDRRPGAIFVVDTKKERIAVHEANRLGIPVIGVVDTNSDPDGIDYIIPSNDDAIRAIKLVASRITDAVLEGSQIYQAKKEAEAQEEAKRAAEAEEEEAAEAVAEEPKKKPRRAGAKKAAPRKKTAAKPPEETPTLTPASETSASAVEEGSQ